MKHASFWKRTAAYLVDGLIYGIATMVVMLLFTWCLGTSVSNAGASKFLAMGFLSFAVQIACYILYYAWPESTSWQATIGKKLFGLKVTDLNGQRISFWRAVGRNLGMILSGLILCVGYLMCLWTEKRQCLHDMLADCLVEDTTPDKKKVATAVVISLYVLLFVAMFGIVTAVAIPQYKSAYKQAYDSAFSGAMEQMRFSQANITLLEASLARDEKELATNSPVTRWDQLDFPFDCTVQSDPSVCKSEDFTYELKENKVTATRQLEGGYYVLSVDKQGGTSCSAYNLTGQDPCKQLLP